MYAVPFFAAAIIVWGMARWFVEPRNSKPSRDEITRMALMERLRQLEAIRNSWNGADHPRRAGVEREINEIKNNPAFGWKSKG